MVQTHSLAATIRSYRATGRPRLKKLLDFYSSLLSLEDAIEKAAFAVDERGKRHPHQHRIKRLALEAARDALAEIAGALVSAGDFSRLYALVERATQGISGLGPLYVYDTALRIGAKIGLDPELVYLHAGTRKGASRLGVERGVSSVSPHIFPPELAALEPKEVEDLLCIYKDDLYR